MDNRYNRHNRRKYSLKVHIVLVTKYRKQPHIGQTPFLNFSSQIGHFSYFIDPAFLLIRFYLMEMVSYNLSVFKNCSTLSVIYQQKNMADFSTISFLN